MKTKAGEPARPTPYTQTAAPVPWEQADITPEQAATALNFFQDADQHPRVKSVDYDDKTDSFSWMRPTTGGRHSETRTKFQSRVWRPYQASLAMNFLQDRRGAPHVKNVDYDDKTNSYTWKGPTTGKAMSMPSAEFEDQVLNPYLRAQQPAAAAQPTAAAAADEQPAGQPAPASAAPYTQAIRVPPLPSLQSLYQAAPLRIAQATDALNFAISQDPSIGLDPHVGPPVNRINYREDNDTYIWLSPTNKTLECPRAKFNRLIWAPYQVDQALKQAWGSLSPAKQRELEPKQREWAKKIDALRGEEQLREIVNRTAYLQKQSPAAEATNAINRAFVSLDQWSDEDKATWQDQINAHKDTINNSISNADYSKAALAAVTMQNWLKAAEPVSASLDKWSDEAKNNWKGGLGVYKAQITASIPCDGGLAAMREMQSWLQAAEPLNTSLSKWSGQDKSTWTDQLAAFEKRIADSIPSDEGRAAMQQMQSWLQAAEPVSASLDKWSDEDKATWQDQLNAYKGKITASIPSDGGLAVTQQMQNWLKTAESLSASLDKWSSGTKSTWQDQLNAYKTKITASVPSGSLAATQAMQNWVNAADPIAPSLEKWSPETNYAWRDELASRMAKITSSMPSDGGLAATQEMQNWVKTIDNDLASGGKLTTRRAQERHKAEEEKRAAEEKAAAERAAQARAQEQRAAEQRRQAAAAAAAAEEKRQADIRSSLGDAYAAALASGKDAALQIHQGYFSYSRGSTVNVMKVIAALGNEAITLGNLDDKENVNLYVEIALQKCANTLATLDDYNAQLVQVMVNRMQENPDQVMQAASVMGHQ